MKRLLPLLLLPLLAFALLPCSVQARAISEPGCSCVHRPATAAAATESTFVVLAQSPAGQAHPTVQAEQPSDFRIASPISGQGATELDRAGLRELLCERIGNSDLHPTPVLRVAAPVTVTPALRTASAARAHEAARMAPASLRHGGSDYPYPVLSSGARVAACYILRLCRLLI